MELTITERIKLLEVLPVQEDILTIKILRKLKETLSFSEEELELFGAVYEFACPYRGEDAGGRMTVCGNSGYFPKQPTCPDHNELMAPTGQMHITIPPEIIGKVKDIHLGNKAFEICKMALKRLSDSKQLTESHESIYDKFLPQEEDEVG